MSGRTFGRTPTCAGCRFWSEMIARAYDSGVQAMCLNQQSGHANRYTTARTHCVYWKKGHLGAIDDPHHDNERAYKIYDDQQEAAKNG